MNFCVEYYELENGTCTVEEFILNKITKCRQKYLKILNCLKLEEMNLESHFHNILKTVFLKSEIKSEMILPEFFISL